LYYAARRWYGGGAGRFVTPDPVVRDSGSSGSPAWNQYAYVLGNPVNYLDRRGLASESPLRPDYCDSMPEHYTCSDFPLDQNPSPAGNPIRPRDESGDREAVRNIRMALRHFSKEKFLAQSGCKKFLSSLLSQTKSGLTVEGFAESISVIANAIADNSYIYDGPSSNAPLTQASFKNSAGPGVSIVGEWFGVSPDRLALGQYDGAAIFVRFDKWEGVTKPFTDFFGFNQEAHGTLLHEILHKQSAGSFDYTHFYKAAAAAGFTGTLMGGNDNSHQIGHLCLGENN